jgi:hypothetical protein
MNDIIKGLIGEHFNDTSKYPSLSNKKHLLTTIVRTNKFVHTITQYCFVSSTVLCPLTKHR